MVFFPLLPLLLTVIFTTPAKATQSYLVKTKDESEESLVSDLDDDIVSANESLDDALESDGADYQNLYNLPTQRPRRPPWRRPRQRPSTGCRGADHCCHPGHQCYLGEGDCDRDSDCHGNLVCGDNNCAGPGFDATDDCCRIGAGCFGGDSCCTPSRRCGLGEGDCDSNSDCRRGLVCGHDNCRVNGADHFDATDDCCVQAFG